MPATASRTTPFTRLITVAAGCLGLLLAFLLTAIAPPTASASVVACPARAAAPALEFNCGGPTEDACPNTPGIQQNLDQCVAAPVDACPDLDGVQATAAECVVAPAPVVPAPVATAPVPTPAPAAADAPAPDPAAGSTAADPALIASIGDSTHDPSGAPTFVPDGLDAGAGVAAAPGGGGTSTHGAQLPFTGLSVSFVAWIGSALLLFGLALHVSGRRVARRRSH